MARNPDKAPTELSLLQLLPNMLTIAAICAGLSAIRSGFHGHYVLAVQLILAAAILDGLDGRVARLLGSNSKMGAELDSLADFLNFGIAPALVLYFWVLEGMPSAAWIAVLTYTVCCVVRLARFNVSDKAKEAAAEASDKATETASESPYFVGVPAPAGALLVMLPMFISFAFADAPILPGIVICFHMVAVGFLMISRIPTWSFKATRISRSNVKFFLVGFAIAGAAVLIHPWITLVVVCVFYVGTVIWALFGKDKS
ncbi:CDP-diacylglycerol--serine O-phosphatidyltransferase [Thalassovita sp.]|uniref:CDP-diacylglycerol--serine O-phosphatidyltransferase n=1 Tax=Thalassovita sp. TaxID=1979401 RepID=UPI002B26D40F|nr:CDP-diacylglycerol--serine O-phosphatidyltransferase [Thalassovita sp.]